MTTTQIIILAILVIACATSLGALIYAIKEYISARKALKAYKAYVQEECKKQPIIYDQYYIAPLSTKESIIETACRFGCSQRRIAKIVGLSQSTVFRIMRKHGWKKAVFKTTSRE